MYLIYISPLLRKKSLEFRSLMWLTLRCAVALVEPRPLPGYGLSRPHGGGKGTICGLRARGAPTAFQRGPGCAACG